MPKRKVIVSDADENLLYHCERCLSKSGYLVITLPKNGQLLWDTIVKERPDIVICNIHMPHCNANILIDRLRKEGSVPMPAFFALTSLDYDMICGSFVRDGGVDVFIRPVDENTINERLNMFCKEQERAAKNVTAVDFRGNGFDQEKEFSDLLKLMGMPGNLHGYKYIKTGVSLMFAYPNRFLYSKRGLYQEIADIVGSNYSKVERNIRTAIETAWARGSLEVQQRFFGYAMSRMTGKPNNQQFFDTVYEYLCQIQHGHYRKHS